KVDKNESRHRLTKAAQTARLAHGWTVHLQQYKSKTVTNELIFEPPPCASGATPLAWTAATDWTARCF
ncbi:MAG: hypothetical protein IPN76_27805, partial [Saprospiraceae bacterium]|nr:hypothetical protein [Saprospiraceae bacterium]